MNLKKVNNTIKKFFSTLSLILLLTLNSCTLDTTYQDIYKIKIGMTYEEVEKIMPNMDVYEYNAPNDYRYAYNYWSEKGYKRTFWIIMRNGKVVNFFSV